eukprot:gnl/Hemi2/19027_TR6295_c0_g1_i2.p1 gnl/Hemi2/19027_TR6295_c0_g1~~gnl/Hemi2/19027_TR6295_c0_g1_i2.p1  ORF type:complete len:266 (-),score=33.59 gnl/Hemi2/19027_TR6295_c0_g1_i2:64-861(-)
MRDAVAVAETHSRLLKQVVEEGHGDVVSPGVLARIRFAARLITGQVFDTSPQSGVAFVLGAGHEVQAWDICVATMKVGERSIFSCPPEYTYGDFGLPPHVPPYATVIFEIELFAVEEVQRTAFEQAALKREEGNSLFRAGRFSDALVAYQTALKHLGASTTDPKSVELEVACYLNCAACLLRFERAREAADCCTKVLARDPQNVKAHFRRAQASALLDEFGSALRDITLAKKLSPNDKSIADEVERITRLREASFAIEAPPPKKK